MTLAFIPWDFLLILALLATIVPWRGAARMKALLKKPDLTSADRVALYASTIVFQVVIVAVVAWRAAARGLTADELALAGGIPWRTASAAIFVTALLCATQIFSLRRISQLPPDIRGRRRRKDFPFLL